MAHLEEVHLPPEPIDRFASVQTPEQTAEFRRMAELTRARMVGRVWWNVNSTSKGGGVAEMLRSVISYGRGAGVDARWLVIEGNPRFFAVTKRLHHALHGSKGDGSPLGENERAIYEEVMHDNATELLALVRRDDVVLLHDPQTAGLVPMMKWAGARVMWRCHVGTDLRNEQVARGWEFLRPYLTLADATVFSRRSYVPDFLADRAAVHHPAIDPFSPKNQLLDADTSRAILVHTGIVEGPPGPGLPVYTRQDGTPGRVDRESDIVRSGRAPAWNRPLVTQVSRWDPLKDPIGVLQGFARALRVGLPVDVDLVLAGPNVHAVADDPEGAVTLDQVTQAWRELPHGERARVHLVSLPMADVEENAAIVNALQRHSAVVVQKSLQEGFGLTVAEAMWKTRPVVASAVGGIQEQIVDGEQGLLLPDARDLDAFGQMLRKVLGDPALATRLALNAHQRVRDHFLSVRLLRQYGELLLRLDALVNPRVAVGAAQLGS